MECKRHPNGVASQQEHFTRALRCQLIRVSLLIKPVPVPLSFQNRAPVRDLEHHPIFGEHRFPLRVQAAG